MECEGNNKVTSAVLRELIEIDGDVKSNSGYHGDYYDQGAFRSDGKRVVVTAFHGGGIEVSGRNYHRVEVRVEQVNEEGDTEITEQSWTDRPGSGEVIKSSLRARAKIPISEAPESWQYID